MATEKLCPTCGEPVRVVSGDEGTSHYESHHRAVLDQLAEELESDAVKIEEWIAEKEREASLTNEPPHLGRHRGEARGLRRAAALLRENRE